LHRWLFYGELQDPYAEFFVSENPELAHIQYYSARSAYSMLAGDGGFTGGGDEEREVEHNGLKLWEGKYLFRKEMLPSFVGESFGKKVSISTSPERQTTLTSLVSWSRSSQLARA